MWATISKLPQAALSRWQSAWTSALPFCLPAEALAKAGRELRLPAEALAKAGRELRRTIHRGIRDQSKPGWTWFPGTRHALALSIGVLGFLPAVILQSAPSSTNGVSEAAPAPPHWAFQPVVRPKVPDTGAAGAKLDNPIDAFIAAKLTEKSLALSPEAGRPTLMRRLYLVMLGMPPSPEEVEAFVADKTPEAFERLVNRVLDDPRYGERWGRHWLDVIRFAESNGFETNRERPNAWRFRDYVIQAFNQDKPFDRFVREQLAGDSLGADVATGYLVGGPVDIVGSPDPVLTAQQRADELDDMAGTTGTAFLGLTLGCARCHNHKFDPIEQREYYAMTAIFSGVKHGDRALPASPERVEKLAALDGTISDLEDKLKRFIPEQPVAQTGAETPPDRQRPSVNALQNEEVLTPVVAKFLRFTVLAANASEPCLDELEVWTANQNVALAAHGTKATASGTLPGYAIHKLEHVNDGQVGNSHSWISNEDGRGWVLLEFPRPELLERVVWSRDREGKFQDRLATNYRIETALKPDAWRLVAGSLDRKPFPGKSTKPAGPDYRFEGVPPEEAAQGKQWLADLKQARAQREKLASTESIYAGNFAQPGSTYRLHRGDPMQKREQVTPGTLAIFHPLELGTNAPERERRLELARWIGNGENPLTARVFVNRVWQHHFGCGLVDTPNDFGRNGAKPSHPELLDWLASEFIAGGWSVKDLQRLILTSATWRQASQPRADAIQVDASSRLLWRFPPRRLEAEAIRDSILTVSGTLDRAMGGPSYFLHDVDRENVYHYQPKEKFGPPEMRRMVYAFKVRMEQDGVFGAFDCPDGSLVMPKRSVSTTPIQALNLFNSTFMLQQSEAFAARLRREAGSNVPSQVRRAYQLAYGRVPDAAEAADAAALVQEYGLDALGRALLNASELMFVP